MSSTQKMKETTKAHPQRSAKDTNYKAPTLNLEHIVFEYNKIMKPRSFKTIIESMAEHMTATLKYAN